jgi:protein arginine N-methyltransferase 1
VLPDLDEHRTYLTDPHRLAAYTQALADLVGPDTVVADLASGTGILGILACRAGAARVYAIEQETIASLARRIADASGFGDRITIVNSPSRLARLPELADLAVCDQIGSFGVNAGILDLAVDAHRKFLRRGGTFVPSRLELFLAPAEDQRGRARLRFWRQQPAGLDCSVAAEAVENTCRHARFERAQLLAQPERGALIDLTAQVSLPLRLSMTARIERDGTLDGLAGWFDASLSAAASMTNSPLASDRIDRDQMFFPIAAPVDVTAGTIVEAGVQMLADDVFAWQVSVIPERGAPRSFLQTSARTMLLTKEDLQRGDPRRRPELNAAGAALLTVLSLSDGTRPLSDIEAEVYRRHRELFPTAADAARFVADVLARHSGP